MVYDVTSTNVDTVDPDIKFTFYPGTETQTRDPLIVADVGEFSTSAHRGLIYAVFDIPLTDYGNRIPNIEAAIAYTGSADTFPFDVMNEITVAEGGLFDTVNTFDFAIDYLRGRMFLLDNTVTEGMRRANWNTMAEDFQLGESDVLTTGGVLDLMHTSPDGFVYMTTDEGTNSGPIARINPDDLTEVDRFGASGSSLSMSPTEWVKITQGLSTYVHVKSVIGGNIYFFLGGAQNSVGILSTITGTLSYIWDSDTFAPGTVDQDARIKGVVFGRVGTPGKAWIISGPLYAVAETGSINIWEMTVLGGSLYDATHDVSVGVSITLEDTLSPSDFFTGQSDLQKNAVGLVYDQVDDSLIWTLDKDALNDSYLVKWKKDEGIKYVKPITQGVSTISGVNQSILQHGTYAN